MIVRCQIFFPSSESKDGLGLTRNLRRRFSFGFKMFKMDIDGLKARLRTLEDQAVDQSSEIAKHSKNIDDMETSYKKFQVNFGCINQLILFLSL